MLALKGRSNPSVWLCRYSRRLVCFGARIQPVSILAPVLAALSYLQSNGGATDRCTRHSVSKTAPPRWRLLARAHSRTPISPSEPADLYEASMVLDWWSKWG